MKFIDQTEIYVAAGHGGAGMVSFQAARNRPNLGPDGGNGGMGGSVYLEATTALNTLGTLRYHRTYQAEDGVRGGTKNCTGANGTDLIVAVPLGTVVHDEEGNKFGELLKDGERLLVAKGGKRGYGNMNFVTPTRRAPRMASPGEKGEARTLKLELKLLADVGLAGFPNAGKSTLLSAISRAKPKIGDYPFTTLSPNLGVVTDTASGKEFVVADIPGLIEGASEGKGLGLEFLRHLERTRIVAYIIDAVSEEGSDAFATLEVLQNELNQYDPKLRAKPSIVVLSKADADFDGRLPALQQEFCQRGYQTFVLSGVSGEGRSELLTELAQMLDKLAAEEAAAAALLNPPPPEHINPEVAPLPATPEPPARTSAECKD